MLRLSSNAKDILPSDGGYLELLIVLNLEFVNKVGGSLSL